jgi:hypothetical protein
MTKRKSTNMIYPKKFRRVFKTYLGIRTKGEGGERIHFFQILNIYIYNKQIALKFNHKE